MSSQPRNDDVRNLEEVAEEEDVVKLEEEEEEEEDGEMAQKIVEYRTTLTSSLLESPRPVLPTQLLNESDPKPPTLPAPDTDAAVSQVMFSSRIELEQAVAEAEEFMEDYMRRYIEDDSAYQRLRRAISKRSRRSRRAGRRKANRKEKR
ncbi:uncharacterized protein LOC131020737 [Salvia miltiorrhiza]|uniref:uncharacterized protein LOC131020737 n=1 Tax=Salvia miltiorrhiza TaxID=226208 RepID=UPI0025ABF5BA|nr:uncharacterized protein LOC131020737 [Salvia miltiorrhiza]